MGDDSPVNIDNLRAHWTPSQDQYFLELLLSHVHKGNKTAKAFGRPAWEDMIEKFNTRFGFKYDVDVLKNRYKRFRKQYNEIKSIISNNGFQWNGNVSMIIAEDKTWNEYIKAHPDVQGFRARVVPHYDDLCKIFGHAIADGRYSLSCFDVGFEYEAITSKEFNDQSSARKEVDDQTPPDVINQSKIDWSPMMDQYFVELMVDQVRKGNKLDRSFKKQAWADMTDSFNGRFGSHFRKVALKNRFNVLRRHYSSISVLLGKEGFSWNKMQQKVVADDQVWQNCIREHHNLRIYRVKSMPFYSSMCIICRDEDTGGKNSMPSTQSHPNADKGALHIGVGKSSNADKGEVHIGGENNPTAEAQPLPDADKEPLLLGSGKNASAHKKRNQIDVPSTTLNQSKKMRNPDEEMAVALKHMAGAVTSLTKRMKKEDTFSIDKVIEVLQSIPDMDDDLILDACDFLEDERRARMFMALDDNLRKKWLLRKLHSG